MVLLKIFTVLLIVLFPIAEVGRIQFANGIAVTLNDVLMAFLVGAWITLSLIKRKKPKGGLLNKPIIIFSAIGLISLILNLPHLSPNNFFVSFLYLIRWLAYACLYFVVKEFDRNFIKKIAYLMLFSGSVVVILGYLQFFFYPSLRNLYYLGWDEHLYRLFSSFLDPNFVGAFLALFFLFSVNFAREFLKRKRKFLFSVSSVIAVLTVIALYLTYSRSALLMLVSGVFVYLFLINQKKLMFVSIVAVLLAVFFLPKAFETEGTNFLRVASSDARIASASQALSIFSKSPLYGVGFNAYRYSQFDQNPKSPDWQITHGGAGTDNSFLFVLATTGVIGFVGFTYLLFKIFSLAFLNLKKNMFAIVLFVSLLGLIVNSLFLNSLFYVLILEWIWILAAFTESS